MHMIAGLLAGFPNFLLYFSVSIIFVLAFKFIYVKLTPYDEWHLIKEKQNTAAAIALSGAFLGYCLAISGGKTQSISSILWYGALSQCLLKLSHLQLYALFYFRKWQSVSKKMNCQPVLY